MDAYSRPSTPFGEKGPFYDPVIGHRGRDYSIGAHEIIPAYEDCTIEYVGRTAGLGLIVGARLHHSKGSRGETLYAGWAHGFGNPGLVTVLKGQGIMQTAAAGDGPGSLWSGPHIHTTISNQSAYAAANGLLPLFDPTPIITANLTGTAGDSEDTLGDAMEATVKEAIRIANVNFTLLNKIIAEQADDADEASVKEAIRIANVNYSILTKLQTQPSAAIDTTKLAAALTAAGLKVTIDSKAIAAAVDASLKDDFLAIPGAVNADAAKRLSS